MLVPLAAAVLAYSFSAGSKALYEFQVNLDGHVLILGRPQRNVEVKLLIQVAGLGPSSDGSLGVTSELLEMKSSVGGTPLPFTVDNVKQFFPKTTLSVTPFGKVLKTDAPDVQMPIRLPGLDTKRLPDISFLPLELPTEGVEVGKPFSFKKSFDGAPATFTATPSSITDDLAVFDVALVQDSNAFEDAYGNPVNSKEGATVELQTRLEGKGKVEFDRKRGLAKSASADTSAVSQVTNLKSGEKSERKVTMKLRVSLRPPGE